MSSVAASAGREQSAARIANRYILRQARTPRAFLLCRRPSPYVMVSLSVPQIDFFYVCSSHLGDRTFCTQQSTAEASRPAAQQAEAAQTGSVQETGVPKEEIDKVIKEWQSKADPAQSAQYKRAPDEQHNASKSSAQHDATGAGQPVESANPIPLHAHYSLHREFFAKRLRMFSQADARHRASQLHFPGVPS